jgi:putative DNA primase/helicase
LQEWFGYIISGQTHLHKILLMVGPSRAGKGVVARILRALIGAANTAGPTLNSLGNDFGLAPLLGKSLAIISDARFTGKNAAVITERLLSISGEDALKPSIGNIAITGLGGSLAASTSFPTSCRALVMHRGQSLAASF